MALWRLPVMGMGVTAAAAAQDPPQPRAQLSGVRSWTTAGHEMPATAEMTGGMTTGEIDGTRSADAVP